MLTKNTLLLLCCLTAISYKSSAQEVLGKAKVDYASKLPEIQAMQKAIDIPVSPFTGQANVSLPIYTIKSNSLSVPITLNYSSGGIKADDKGGTYGLGWTLAVGGSITRVIRGNEDEGLRFETRPRRYTQLIAPTTYYIWATPRDSIINAMQKYGGFYIDGGNIGHSSDALYNEFSSHNQALSNGNVPPESALPYFYNGLCDGEPDIFYFNFGEYSGKFIFGSNRTPILLPYNQDLQISVDLRARLDSEFYPLDTIRYKGYYFNSFKISTTEGKDYYFGETEASKIYTPIFNKPNLYNGWQLTKIIDRTTADTILFDYGGVAPANVLQLQNKQLYIRNNGEGCNDNPLLRVETQTNYKGNLASIISSKEKIVFIGKTLIKIVDKNTGEAFRQFQLTYTNLPSKRSALQNLIERDLKLNISSIYTFEYYSQGTYGGASAQDFWGYHNGIDNGNKLLIGYNNCSAGAANRYAAWPAMQLDALSSVIYPTGGRTIFEYEPHDAFSGRTLNDQIVESDAYFVGQGLNFNLIAPNSIGGLRIRRIMQYDPVSKDTLIKKFIYKRFGTSISSGHLYTPPSLNVDYSSLSCGGGILNPLYLRSTQNLYIGSGTSQHVSYNNVTVQEEKNGITNGYTEYEYYNDRNTDSSFYSNALTATTNYSLNAQYNLFPSTQFKRLPENYLDGKEKEKRVYNRSGALLTKETTIYQSKVYPGYQSAILFNAIYKRDVCDMFIPPNDGGSAPSGISKYSQFIRDAMQDVCDITNSSMGYNACSVNEEQGPFNGGGNAGKRPILPPPYTYYYMYRYAMSKMAVLPYQLIHTTYETATKTIIDTTTYLYENPDHINPTSVITRNSKGEINTQQTLYSFDFNGINNGDSTFYFMKKAFVNIPVASLNYTNANISSGGYRMYKYKSRADSTVFFPIEEYTLLASQTGTPPASLNISSTFPKILNMPAAYFQKVASYRYNSDNSISYVTKKGNEKIVLQWDYNKSFVVAQSAGADSADIAFTSFETSYNGSWTVVGTARDTLYSMTGKKSYNLSGGNITRAGLNAAKTYIVSYWSQTNAATVNTIAGISGVTKNGWKYYEHKLPSSTTSITISGAIKMDELKLYPVSTQLTTYTFNPLQGITSTDAPDNTITYYEYDGFGRLRFIRDADKNILKSATYFNSLFASDTAVWKYTGDRRQKKCASDTNYYSLISQREQININPNSPTFDGTRWVDETCIGCDIAAWTTTTTTFRCQKNASNNNTGYREIEQKDMNPCSPTYNQLQWVVAGVNATACPVPQPCTGEEKRMINGVCVTGTKIITASVYVQSMGKWSSTYHYAWPPDCAVSIDYVEYKTTPSMPGGSCIPL